MNAPAELCLENDHQNAQISPIHFTIRLMDCGFVTCGLDDLGVAYGLFFQGQHRLQIGEWIEGGDWCDTTTIAASLHVFDLRMLVFVAVRAQQFPVATIRSVVMVVIVLVMHFQ